MKRRGSNPSRAPARCEPSPAAARESLPSASGLGFFIAMVAAMVLAFHAGSYLPFIADDALISLRYAERLLDGHGLTWNDGERVEGYSNLLWVLMCSGLGALGLDLVVATRVLGFVCGAATLVAVNRAFAMAAPAGVLPALAGALTIALAAPFAVWTIGGLETPLYAALFAWALAMSMKLLRAEAQPRDAILPSVLLGLLCITRPDGIVLATGVCAGVVVARGRGGLKLAVGLAAGPIAFTLLQLAFRLAYYGEWIANSSRAKLGFSLPRWWRGVLYLADGAVGFAPLIVGIVVALIVARGTGDDSRRLRFFLAPLLVWMAYVSAVGGDLFPARRFFVPLVVISGFVTAVAVARVLEHRRASVVGGVALALLAVFGAIQFVDPAATVTRFERWEWDGKVIGQFLARAFGDRAPRLAVDPAGAVPYWSRLPAIDLLGLCDSWLAHHPPEDFGTGKLGHELGSGRYVLSREPDLVMLCAPTGRDTGCFRSGKELVADSTFTSRYALVTYAAEEPYLVQSRIWTRREGGKLGIVREPDRVTVPGWLLIGNPASVTRLDAGGKPAVLITRQVPAILVDLELPAGSWKLALDGDRRGIRIEARGVASATLATGIDSVAFDHARGRVDVGLSPADAAQAHVRALIFQRIRNP